MFGRKYIDHYLTFSVIIEKHEIGKTIKHKTRFFNGVSFMVSFLSSLTDNRAEALRKSKRKDCKSGLEYSQKGHQEWNLPCRTQISKSQ